MPQEVSKIIGREGDCMTPIDDLYNELKDVQGTWASLYDLLKRGKYDTSAPRPAIEGVSVDVLNKRASLFFEIVNSLRPEDDQDVSAAVVSAYVADIRAALSVFKNNVQACLNQATPHLRENTTIRSGNDNLLLQFFDGEAHTANIDASAHFKQMNLPLKQLLTYVTQLLPICKAGAVGDLSARANALADVVRNAETLRSEAKTYTKAAEKSATNAAESAKAAMERLTHAETVHAKLKALQQEMDKEAASVNSLIAQIKTTGASAGTLEKQVAGYQASFDAFQKQLDDRNKQFSEFENNFKVALEQNVKRDDEIIQLIEKADTMIRGATTAGLSKSLDDTRKLYGRRMIGAGVGFLVSILLLAVSALPLAAHLLPGMFGDLVPAITEDAKSSAIGVLGKIILLLPGTWLTLFFSKTFTEFFHLEREYAHKAALAKSVDGFKREAPKYEEEITASVFGEILNNPSSRQSPEPAQHPIYEVVTKRLSEWFKGKK